MNEVLAIIAFNLILYFRTLRFSICVDDIRWYKRIQDGAFDRKMDIKTLVRERLYGGGLLGRAKPGEAPNAHYDHAITIALHTTASVLIYFAFGASQISFWAAILYSCNPTNTQTSVWLNGRRYLINVILILTMVILAKLKYGWIACLPLYATTGLFQVTAVAAPILFLGWFSIPVAGLFYLLFRDTINHKIKTRFTTIFSKDWRVFTPKRMIVVVKTYGFYFFKTFLPGLTLMNYPTLFYWGVTKEGNKDAYAFNFDFYKGLLGIGISLALLVIVPTVYRPYVIFTFLAILQWCAIIPATQLLADRYLSSAMPFMMFLMALFCPWYVCLALAGFYTAKLWYAMEMFESIWSYYKYQIYHAPHITTPRKDLINYFVHTGDHLKAWHYTREGLEYTPNDFSMLHRAAICARAIGSTPQSLEYLAKAEQNFYLDQEESQQAWVDEFKKQMRNVDLAQLDGRKKKRF